MLSLEYHKLKQKNVISKAERQVVQGIKSSVGY
jgi:hypothetical protein